MDVVKGVLNVGPVGGLLQAKEPPGSDEPVPQEILDNLMEVTPEMLETLSMNQMRKLSPGLCFPLSPCACGVKGPPPRVCSFFIICGEV